MAKKTRKPKKFPIEKYVLNPKNPDTEEAKNFEEEIALRGGPQGTKAFKMEKALLPGLCFQKARIVYPELDPGIFSESSCVRYAEVKENIQLPLFGIYALKKEPTFRIVMEDESDGKYDFEASLDNLPEQTCPLISTNIFRALEFSSNCEKVEKGRCSDGDPFAEFYGVDKTLLKKYREKILSKVEADYGNDEHVYFANTLSQLIPRQVRAKLEDAVEKCFKEDQIFVVSQNNNWSASYKRSKQYNLSIEPKRISSDSLLVGIMKGRIFVVDQYEPTTSKHP